MLALAGPSTAVASAATVPVLDGGPVTLGRLGRFSGYRMVVEAKRLNGRTSVAVELVRMKANAVQATVFSFNLPPSALRIGRDLRRATLDTRSALGRFGRIRMSFVCRKRNARAPTSPCLGSSRARRGTLTGSFELRPGAGIRVRKRSLPARLAFKNVSPGPATGQPSVGRPSCNQYPRATVLALPRSGGLGGFLAVRPRSGPIALFVAVIRDPPTHPPTHPPTGRPATETVAVQSLAPRSTLTLNGTRSARLNVAGAPFVLGWVRFSRSIPVPGCPVRGALGTATGSLRLRSDFFGTVQVLTKRGKPPAILIGPASR